MTRISVTGRIALCLTCLSICSLLTVELLGLIPNARVLERKARGELCEAIAINCSLLASRKENRLIEANLKSIVARNPGILSAALRGRQQELLVEVGDHTSHWQANAAGRSSDAQVYVPIIAGTKPWGTVEIRFASAPASGLPAFMSHPTVRALIVVTGVNLLLFAIFLRKSLKQLNPSNVIPERVRTALDTLAEGLLVLDDRQRIVLANKSFASKLGCAPESLQGSKASALPWADAVEGKAVTTYPWEGAPEDKSTRSGEMLSLRIDGGDQRMFMVSSAPILCDKGTRRGVLASFEDVTELEGRRVELLRMLEKLQNSRLEIQKQNRELQILATRDPLTGCLNRRSFFEQFEQQLAAAQRYGHALSCLMLDIDFFKSINDEHGHAAGDTVLTKVGSLLRDSGRNSDCVCRYGGEEFCILLPHVDREAAERAAERLRIAVSELSLPQISVTVSIGVAVLNSEVSDPQMLLNRADQALYAAKRAGRNRFICWDESVDHLPVDAETRQERSVGVVAPDPHDVAIPFHAVSALLSALAYRDAATAAHSTRVADLCVATGRDLLSAGDVYILEIAALLHDIGKIGVPDSILLKPGPLTEEEWKEMSVHDRIGVEILRSSFASPKLSAIVDTHHAFYGGKGRNEDLPTGDTIPLGARILSIADAYDAMVSDRVYRKGRSPEEAFVELRRCAGSQFDPELVERFIKVAATRFAGGRQAEAPATKETALQIGMQIERLTLALDQRDYGGLQSLSARLEATAAKYGLPEIERVAGELRAVAGEDAELKQLVQLTHDLLDLCRSTRAAYLGDGNGRTRPEPAPAGAAGS